jgi:hypothetical protein
MYALFTRARRVLAPTAEVAVHGDPRPPMLFLRSFQDDKTKLKARVRLAGLPAMQQLRLEEAIELMLSGLGPFLAVGEPGEGLPQLGAARVYLAEDEWQNAVLAWIRGSSLIIMLAGPTPWIKWETQNILQHRRLDRLVLLVPPGRKPPGSRQATDRLKRWHNILESFSETPYGAVLGTIDIGTVLLVQFRPNRQVRVFRSEYDLAQDYELALTLALHGALSEVAPQLEQVADGPVPLVFSHASPPAAESGSFGGWVLATCGLAAGSILGLLSGSVAPNIYRPIAAVTVGLGVGAGVWFGFGRKTQSAIWLFAIVAISVFAAQTITPPLFQLVRPQLPAGTVNPLLIQWVLATVLVLTGGTLRFRSFRRPMAWVLLLSLGVLVGLLAPLGFTFSEGRWIAALRFQIVPYALFASCLGIILSRERYL